MLNISERRRFKTLVLFAYTYIVIFTFSCRKGRFLVETESGFEVESLNAADGLRLPSPSLRLLDVPTQPPITITQPE